jgi:hypothetical protein
MITVKVLTLSRPKLYLLTRGKRKWPYDCFIKSKAGKGLSEKRAWEYGLQRGSFFLT